MAKKAKKTARRASKRNVRRASPQRRRRRVVREAARPLRTVRSRTASRVQRKPAASARSAKRPVIQQASRLTTFNKAPQQKSQDTLIGEIQHYYTHLGVGVLEVHSAAVQVGDKIHIKGATTDFVQVVRSMQLDHASVQRAEKGQSVGLKVDQHVREHDKVYRL